MELWWAGGVDDAVVLPGEVGAGLGGYGSGAGSWTLPALHRSLRARLVKFLITIWHNSVLRFG